MRVLITGASRGLGYALTEKYVNEGHEVLAAIRPSSNTDKLEQLSWKNQGSITLLKMDITKEDSVTAAKYAAEDQCESLDGIINNAGLLVGREKSIESIDINELRASLEINAIGHVSVTKAFSKMLYKGNNQFICNITSNAGSLTEALDHDYAYGIAKAAANMFSQILHNALARKNILVFAVHPGWMRTDMGGEEAPNAPETSAEAIYRMTMRQQKLQGTFVHLDGTRFPF